MTLNPLYFLLVLLLATTSCTAQIDLMNATKGNTGHRGIIPRDENGNHIEQPKGKDYYAIEVKCKKRCNIELVSLSIKGSDGQTVVLLPNFTESNSKKCKMTTEQTCSIRAERDETATNSKQTLTGEGVLKVKINGKIKSMPIENFTMIMPQ
jgi:hypothetical protein